MTGNSPRMPLGIDVYAAAYMAAGWRVFPVRGKQPSTRNGVHDASLDPKAIPYWWPQGSGDGVAVATGRESGFFVLDLDGDDAVQVFCRIQAEVGERLPLTITSKTARGWHAFFAMPTDRDVRNSASKVGAGIDVRGTGGYVVLPPSPHPSGARYTWSPGLAPWEVPAATAPSWLVDRAAPGVRLGFTVSRAFASIHRRHYVRAAVEAEVGAVASAPEGTRNDQLNRSAFALARFVASGDAEAFDLASELAWAATQAGLAEEEIRRTLASAFGARGLHP